MASNEKHRQRWLHQDHDHEPWFVIVPDDQDHDHEQRRAPDDQDHDHEQRRTRAPVPRWLPDDHDDDSPRTVWVAKTGYRYHMDFGCSGATLPMALPQAKLLGRTACLRCPGTRRTVSLLREPVQETGAGGRGAACVGRKAWPLVGRQQAAGSKQQQQQRQRRRQQQQQQSCAMRCDIR